MSDVLLDMQREIDRLKRKLDAFESGGYLTGPKVSVPGNLRTESDLQVGSGVVVGNADPTLNPANGNVWLQEQSALPAATGGVLKLLNYKNNLHFVESNGGTQPYAIVEGWMKIEETFTYAPAQTNLVTNPSFEVNTTDWLVTGAGSSISRVTPGLWGSWCLRAVMAGPGATHMAYCTPVAANGVTYRAGFHARSISGNVNLHSELWGGNGVANVTLTTSWQWFSYSAVGTGNSGFYFWLGAAGTFEIDGVYLIQTTLEPPYSDPSITGSGQDWTGTAHLSTSTRLPCYYISGNWTGGAAHFEPGVKLLVNDGGWKQFYSIGWWLDIIRNLTVFIPYAGSTYTPVANPAHLYVSRFAHPKGFSHWFDYAPSFGGFSAAPTGVHRFKIEGRTCTVVMRQVSGTSNATNFWASLPVREAVTIDVPTAQSIDNGSTLAAATIAEISGKIASFFTNPAGTGWTASGSKYVRTVFSFEWY